MPTKYFSDFHEGSWIHYNTGLGIWDTLPDIKHIKKWAIVVHLAFDRVEICQGIKMQTTIFRAYSSLIFTSSRLVGAYACCRV